MRQVARVPAARTGACGDRRAACVQAFSRRHGTRTRPGTQARLEFRATASECSVARAWPAAALDRPRLRRGISFTCRAQGRLGQRFHLPRAGFQAGQFASRAWFRSAAQRRRADTPITHRRAVSMGSTWPAPALRIRASPASAREPRASVCRYPTAASGTALRVDELPFERALVAGRCVTARLEVFEPAPKPAPRRRRRRGSPEAG